MRRNKKNDLVTAPKPKGPPEPTAEQLSQYLKDEDERLRLQRILDGLARRTRAFHGDLVRFLKSRKVKVNQSIEHAGHLLTRERYRASVLWMDAYIQQNGEVAAEDLRQKQPHKDRCKVSKAA